MKLPFNPAIPPLGIYPDKTIIQRETCTLMFTAALFVIAKKWKQPKCPPADAASASAARYGRGATETRRTEPGPRVRRGCGPKHSAERQGQGPRGRGPAPCVVWLRPGGEVGGCVRACFPFESPILESLPGAGPRRGEARTGGLPSPARGYRFESQPCLSSCLAHWRAQAAGSTVRMPPTSSFYE